MTSAEAHVGEVATGAADDARAPDALAALALAGLVLVAAFYPTLHGLFKTWLTSSSYHHGFAVAPLALWLCLRLGPPEAPARIWPPALLAVLGGLLIWLVGRAADVALVEQLAFVSILIALTALFLGPDYVRRWSFPLGFLIFMVPFGAGFLPPLQDIAASGVVALLNISGIEAAREAVMISTSAGRFEIAEACAGLNFLIAAVMIAALFTHLAFASARKSAAFVIFAGFFALAANILRAYAVILIATLSNGGIAIASNHFLFGWAFYGALIVALILIGRAFADARKEPAARGSWAEPLMSMDERRDARLPVAVAAALTLILCGAIYERLVIAKPPQAPAPSFLPLMSAPGWQVLPTRHDWRAPLDHADRMVRARYQAGPASVEVNAAYFTHERPGAEIVGYDTRSYDGREWRRVAHRAAPVMAYGALRKLDVETLENVAGERLDVITLYWLGDAVFVDPIAVKWRQMRARLTGRQQRGGVIIIAAPDNAQTQGLRSIDAFLMNLEPLDAWLARIDARYTN